MGNETTRNTKDKEGQEMNATVQKVPSLDLNRLRARKVQTVSTETALQDIIPVRWPDDVLYGRKKVYIISTEENE